MVFMASVQFLYFRIGDKYVHICKELKESLKKTLWAIFAFVIIMVLFAIGVVIFLAKYYSGNATIGEIAQIGTFLTVFTVLMIAFLTPVIRFCILMIRHIRTEIGFYRFFRLFNSQNMMFNMQILTLYIQLKAWMQGTILLGYFIPMTVTYLGICVCFIAKRFLCLFRHFYLAQKILLGILFSLHLILSLLYLSLVLDNDKERPVKICEFVFIYILIVTNNGDWYRDKHLAKPRKYVRFSGALGLPLLNSAALAVALKLKADTGKQPLDLRLIVLISGSVFLFGWFVIQMSAYWLDKEEKIKEAFTQIKDPDPDQVLSTDPEMCELIQERLDRLLHAQQCQWEKQDLVFHQFWRCSKPHCCTMRKVLKHMANCKNSTSCQVKHCASSRRIMSKWEEGYIWSYKPKLIQEQLELLQHADRCQCKKQEFSQWSCSRPHCATMGKVLKHIKEDCNCQAGTSCQVKHCASSRRIISENKGYVWSYIATEESSTEV
nr:uncharacterized protein LOC111842596 isoform X2 [Paramormyrops kingsleyae]